MYKPAAPQWNWITSINTSKSIDSLCRPFKDESYTCSVWWTTNIQPPSQLTDVEKAARKKELLYLTFSSSQRGDLWWRYTLDRHSVWTDAMLKEPQHPADCWYSKTIVAEHTLLECLERTLLTLSVTMKKWWQNQRKRPPLSILRPTLFCLCPKNVRCAAGVLHIHMKRAVEHKCSGVTF